MPNELTSGSPSASKLSQMARMLFRDCPIGLRTIQHLRPYISPFEELLPFVPRGSRVLDIGCGAGLMLGLLAGDGRISHGLGVDRSRKHIRFARRMSEVAKSYFPDSKLDFLESDASVLLPAGPFDVVMLIDVMHHVPRAAQQVVFDNAVRQLAPHGVMIYKDMAIKPTWKAIANRFHDLILARQWINYCSIHDIEKWAIDRGMVNTASESYSRLWYAHDLRIFCK